MKSIIALREAQRGLAQLRTNAVAEYESLTLREKVAAHQREDLSFLDHATDGGFLYGVFPGGGWGQALHSVMHAERYQTIEVSQLIEIMFESWYDEEFIAEENEERALLALETSDAKGCVLLRAVLEAGVYSFVFDW